MRTGKYHYLKYVTIWAVNIIAKTKGYSIERAYEINPLFGSLVESKIKYYEQYLKYAMQVAMSFQVFDDMLEEYGNFQKQLNEDTEFLKNNKYDWDLDYEYENLIPTTILDFKGNSYGPDEEEVKELASQMGLQGDNENIDVKKITKMLNDKKKSLIIEEVKLELIKVVLGIAIIVITCLNIL